jgi:hypothetical protein
MKPLRTSASDLETCDPKASGCYRKWFLKKIAKLPEPATKSTVFGDVLHAVCERFLLADENGNLNGKPVELYPEGWERPINRYTGQPTKEAVTLEEQAIIKALISKAIIEGVLMRVEGRKIERKIDRFEIYPGVVLNGFIDLLEPDAIRDHKTTKSMDWAKSIKRDAKESLYKNVQLMTYAYWYYTEGGHSKELPLKLSHQYFVTNPDKTHVEKREISVTWAEVEEFFSDRIAPTLDDMLKYREVKDYSEIPLPIDVASACRKYGGCPFTRICTEQETVNEYKKRLETQAAGVTETNYTEVAKDLQQGEKKMSNPMMDKIKAMQAAKRGEAPAAPAPAPVTVAAPPPPPPPAPVAPPPEPVAAKAEKPAASEKPKAPWYFSGCKSCAENDILGLNSKGTTACRICDMMTKKLGGKDSSQYKWTVADGKLTVSEGGQEVMTNQVVTSPVTSKEVIAEEAAIPSTIPAPEPTPEPIYVVVPPPPEPEPVAEAAPVSSEETVFEGLDIASEREKFTVLIGCAVIESKVKGGGKLGSPSCRVTSEELLILVEAEMVRIMTASRWESLNGFQKREAVGIYSKQIAELLGASTLTVARLPKASLLETIVLGIRPYAGTVIQALAD